MADQSDVETVLAALAASALYPAGTDQPSIAGATCRIYRGWPSTAALDADLAAGRINVTIYPEPRHQENTTRYPDEWQQIAVVSPTLTVAVDRDVVSFGGVADPGQLAGLLVDARSVAYRTTANDTPERVAAVLADLLRAQRPVTLSGARLTVPGAGLLVARVLADQPGMREVRRQMQGFRISCWCPDPGTRDIVARTIDVTLASLAFIDLPDGTVGRMRLRGSYVFDQSQDAALYRRDLLYTVEYATTVTADLPSMLFGTTTLAPDASGPVTTVLS